ncbi:MAG: hypothetical protein UV05_C0030G0006 [candidate division CPR1 bacterium GW2011_GWA2_42_17]|uniref:Uncharacterized protein n=1 Tax=candidate division CPR1 bacterium GW2011_GWA2_42_17 TaxID=1618341 RepID=A0A0G0Z4A1_9BACT|nr:MAG: hypothetical protein UV05_C0030G0006 [candidate division CPR1 bacterium GW2011_GWA2_42_17]
MKLRELFKEWKWLMLGLISGFFSYAILANVLWWPLSLISLNILILFFIRAWPRRLWFWSGALLSAVIFFGAAFFPSALLSFLVLAVWRASNNWHLTKSFYISGLWLWLLMKIAMFSGFYFFSGTFFILSWRNLLAEVIIFILCLLVGHRFRK